MSQWSLDNPPNLPYLEGKKPIATNRGWVHPTTGEVLVTIRGLAAKASEANVIKVEFVEPEDGFLRGEDLNVKVYFNEAVDVTAGSTLVLTTSGGTLTLKAAAQTGVQEALYSKQSDGTTQEVIPDAADTYTVGAQTLGGTIKDSLGAVAASLVLTFTANPSTNDTVTLNSKVYTFKSTLTDTDGYVKLGANLVESIENLVAAINLETGAGTRYATSTTLHSTISASKLDSTLIATAKTAGTGGNSLTCAESCSVASWAGGATALAGGTTGATSSKVISSGVALAGGTVTVPSGVITAVEFDDATLAGGDNLTINVTFDQSVNVPAGASIVVTSDASNDAGNITVYAAAQSDVTEAVFNKKVDNTTQQVVPATTSATATLTNDTVNVTNADTVTIGNKTFTFQDTLTNVDGNVKIGASATASMTNLFRAINGTGGTPGTDYAAATVAHTQVTATNPSATTVVVTAVTPGHAANAIAVSEVSSHLTFGAAVTLTGGATNVPTNLSIAAQTLGGSIVDNGNTAIAATKTISSTIGAAAGVVAIAA